tara:strand:- start:614 stop:1417 length:804 start_codon:yes stop_codon:yes gene_type:complete
MEISFNNDPTEWGHYGYAEPGVLYNGEDTDFKGVVHGDRLVKIVSKKYWLYPNEEAMKAADMAAKMVGLDQFASTTPGMQNEDHVVWSNDGNRVRALYTLQGQKKVDGDKVNVGVNVYNSIDGTTSFGVGLFTFRGICSNGVIFGRRDIRQVRHAHTKGLANVVEAVRGSMVTMLEQAVAVVESYRRMAQEKVNQKLINKLADSYLSKKVLPDYVHEDEATIPDLTQWDIYNDITEAIWHNEKTGIKSKEFQFTTLHKIMPVVPRRF